MKFLVFQKALKTNVILRNNTTILSHNRTEVGFLLGESKLEWQTFVKISRLTNTHSLPVN